MKSIEQSRRQTDELFDIVHPNAFYERPIEARHRIIFYLGHLEVFDWNLICRTTFEKESLHKEFERLFAFGIDPVNGNLPSDKPSDWPSIDEVRRYNARAREAVDTCLRTAGSSTDLISSVAVEHRLMHLETISYMLHWLPFESKIPIAPPANDSRPRARRRQVRIPAGAAKLGLRRNDSVFGWDNEFEGHTVNVPEFEIDAYKISNGDFLEFINAGAYSDRSLWTSEAWEWITRENIRHPKFWVERENEWMLRAMFGETLLPLSWPVYVSHAEAAAYARWDKSSLPTEAEFHRAAFGNGTRDRAGNFGFQRWDPIAVDSNTQGVSSFGVVGLIGNGWEWTSTLFAPFPGFERFPFYPGYSADFFDDKHYVLKGASPRTAVRLTRSSFRNWFQPHYPYVYASFRCVRH